MFKFLKKFGQWLLKRQRLPSKAQAIKICVLGPPASGKTALVRQFLNALADGSAPRLPVKLLFSPGEDAGQDAAQGGAGADLVTHWGTLDLGGKTYRVQLVDAKGSLLLGTKPPAPDAELQEWPPLYQATWDADLLVLMLGPEELDQSAPPNEVMNHLLAHVKLAVEGHPEAMIAIAYGKADEYGILDPQALRVVSERRHLNALDEFRHAEYGDIPVQWESLLDAVAGPKGGTDKSAELRRTLLDRTRLLWESIAYQLHHRFVNGYFVAAQPIDDRYRPWTRRGLLQLFADFFDHVGETRAQPTFGNWIAAFLLLLTLGAVGGGLWSFHTGQIHVAEARRASQQFEGEQRQWEAAAQKDTIDAYQGYLTDNAKGVFVSEATQRIEALKRRAADDQAWQTAAQKDTVSDYEGYLAAYPKGLHVADARARIVSLKPQAVTVRESYYLDLKRDWEDALRAQTAGAFRAFMDRYPDSTLREAASAWIEKLNERQAWPHAPGQDPAVTEPWRRYVANVTEGKAWDAAQKSNSIKGYREYLAGYEDAPHAPEAVRRIKGLEAVQPH
jgi:hypothetical protein